MKIIDIRATPIAVPLAAPLRHANGCHWGRFVRTIVEVENEDGANEVRTVEQLVHEAAELKRKHGFTTHKLKGGVFCPEYELECYRAVAESLPGDRFRFDPNGVWSTEQAIAFAHAIEDLDN